MRHNKTVKKLGVTKSHREAMHKNMVTSLMEHGRVTTTHSRAKPLKSLADKMVSLAIRNTLQTRRLASETIRNKTVLSKLFNQIGPEFTERSGGYTRILKKGFRKGDNASVSIVELVNYVPAVSADEEKGKKKGFEVIIVTNDKDALQLVDEHIKVLNPHTSEDKLYGMNEAKEKYGIDPSNMVELMALMGDSTDNIPGVKGVGVVTASKLIKEYGTVNNIYENIDKISSKALKEKLVQGKRRCLCASLLRVS